MIFTVNTHSDSIKKEFIDIFLFAYEIIGCENAITELEVVVIFGSEMFERFPLIFAIGFKLDKLMESHNFLFYLRESKFFGINIFLILFKERYFQLKSSNKRFKVKMWCRISLRKFNSHNLRFSNTNYPQLSIVTWAFTSEIQNGYPLMIIWIHASQYTLIIICVQLSFF